MKLSEDNKYDLAILALVAIVLNGSDTEEHVVEYAALQEWRAEAKHIAKIVVGKQM